MSRQQWIIAAVIGLMIAAASWVSRSGAAEAPPDYIRASHSPLHFKPAIDQASDAQCLACHREVLEDKARPASPAGLRASDTRAWYQQTSTYQGAQETFHRRHLVTAMAKQLMDLRCTTCHQGHDPREEAQGSSATTPGQNDTAFTLRKQVNPETTCLKCHGQMNWQVMGLPGPWLDVRETMGNNCVSCHQAIRTTRHQVTYLKADAIEAAGKDNADVCFGCHGGRAWYRINYPYPRHAWPEMPKGVPDWARDRPTASEPRFRLATETAARTYKP